MLALRCVLPSGRYEASLDEDGLSGAEWPPHPWRLVAALCAGAARLGCGDGPGSRRAARDALVRLSCLDPPLIDTPKARERPGASVYVPISPPESALVSPSEKASSEGPSLAKAFGRGLKKEHPPLAAMLFSPDSAFTLWWPDADDAEELAEALDPAARQVPYLGRPTSLALVSVLATPLPGTDDIFAQTHERWRPSSGGAGSVAVRVPDETTLAALDVRWQRTLATGVKSVVPGVQRVAYRREHEESPKPSASAARDTATVLSIKGAPDGPLGLRILQSVAHELELDPQRALPVLNIFGPAADGRLLGMVTPQRLSAQALRRLSDPVGSVRVARLIGDPRFWPTNINNAVRSLHATSRWWTTVTPLRVPKDNPREALEKLGTKLAAQCTQRAQQLSATTMQHYLQAHQQSRQGLFPLPATALGSTRATHATITFARPVSGPLVVPDQEPGWGVLWPITQQGDPL